MGLNYILKKAETAPLAQRQNAAKEALQECILAALAQAGLLRSTAFIGGTALRILHGLPRFSEDLDFIWVQGEPQVEAWLKTITRYLGKIGVTPHARLDPIHNDPVSGKRTQTLYLSATAAAFAKFAREGLQISFEFDFDPPEHVRPEVRTLAVANTQATIPTLELPSLMAGKLHILLTRRDREKGRDWYDYLWYRDHDVVPNVAQLQSAIDQTTKKPPAVYWMSYLRQRLSEVNWLNIQNDVKPFLENPKDIGRLNEVSLGNMTPPPPFAELDAELQAQGKAHWLVTAGDDDPVLRDINQFALEGDVDAIYLRDRLREMST